MKKGRRTIEISGDIHQRIKIESVLNPKLRKMKDVIDQVLELGLKEMDKEREKKNA